MRCHESCSFDCPDMFSIRGEGVVDLVSDENTLQNGLLSHAAPQERGGDQGAGLGCTYVVTTRPYDISEIVTEIDALSLLTPDARAAFIVEAALAAADTQDLDADLTQTEDM